MLIVVVWSKTTQFCERTVYIPFPYIHNSPHCPVSSLKHAMSFTYSAPPSSHAFSYYDLEHLQIRCFTYKQFLSKLRSCLSILGYPPDDYAGHSFRRGGYHLPSLLAFLSSLLKCLETGSRMQCYCILLFP